jgi:hypothetical protein
VGPNGAVQAGIGGGGSHQDASRPETLNTIAKLFSQHGIDLSGQHRDKSLHSARP